MSRPHVQPLLVHGQVAKLVVVNPCALRALDGSPVSIFHVGTAQNVKALQDDVLQRRHARTLCVHLRSMNKSCDTI